MECSHVSVNIFILKTLYDVAASMFPIFSQLPKELRRQIWLATLGPMTLTFTAEHPSLASKKRRELRQASLQDGLSSGPISPLGLSDPCFGHVELEDGTSRLYYAVESTAAYRACKESRAFLHFFFAVENRAQGGLPFWYRSEMDIIKLNIRWIEDMITHPWFLRTQHLVLTMSDEEFYLGEFNEIGHGEIERRLSSLRDVTIRMNDAFTYAEDYPAKNRHWLTDWFRAFEEFYNPESEWSTPLRFHLRVVSDSIPEEEWLSPTNYLRVEKLVHQKMLHFDPQHEKRDWGGRKAALMRATDDELNDPAGYLAKRRLEERLRGELESYFYRSIHGEAPSDEEWDV